MRQKPASPISSSARARLTTRAHGTRSSAPDAALATTPLSGGEWRSWVTMPTAPNAAAERRIAPTLCGSVTWSSTSSTARSGALGEHVVEPHVLERLDLDHHALVRRVVRHQPAEVGDVGERHRDVLGKLHEARGLARRPGLSTLRSGLSSAAATACLPHSRGRLAVPWLWWDFLRRDMARLIAATRARARASLAQAACDVAARRVAMRGAVLRQVPTARISRIG